MQPAVLVVMGVAGCGKTTVGQALATALGCAFVDGDDLHSAANREQMSRGVALTDAQRQPWLDAVRDRLHAAEAAGETLVIACSALRRSYRQRLAEGLQTVRFVHLRVDRDTAAARLRGRAGHFFAADLLDSQFETLEPLQTPPEPGWAVDGASPTAAIVAAVRTHLTAR
ncbi:MAG: gluconokinase [Planctomycetes bacterium]|nr:gluconokinase [Planctomycetota bacterium]MCB9886907.1 gluconokinase [Planctomycetota bacterium]